MKVMLLKYPGDMPERVREMSRSEFLELFPRQPVRVYSNSGCAVFPMADDEIACDFCNDDPLDYILVVGNKAVCRKCAGETFLPHCEEVP